MRELCGAQKLTDEQLKIAFPRILGWPASKFLAQLGVRV